MHIVENLNAKTGRIYCYASQCLWNKQSKKYDKPRISVGHLEDDPSTFIPNRTFGSLLLSDTTNPNSITAHDRTIIDAVKAKYGDEACRAAIATAKAKAQTANTVHS
ncbi:MAG: hypothetical protein LBI74_00205 [Synergistaceae bacterium]|jgi:hypothetical protein|nr:hypothetical protein [Synergistaceae bacterium]